MEHSDIKQLLSDRQTIIDDMAEARKMLRDIDHELLHKLPIDVLKAIGQGLVKPAFNMSRYELAELKKAYFTK